MNCPDYYGFPANRLSNSLISFDYLTTAGPRIVRLMIVGDDRNILYETPQTVWETPNGPFRLLGGHRLWKSPEKREFTYIPDSEGLRVENTSFGVRLIQNPEAATGIQKSLEISVEDQQPVVHLKHQMVNCGSKTWTLSLWALTMLPLGGTATIPWRPEERDPEGLLPDRNLVLWPYTRIYDQRLKWGDENITLTTSMDSNPVKLGIFQKDGWLEYRKDGISLKKQIRSSAPDGIYPDQFCNLEVYTNHEFLELETLSPLVTLNPGESAVHCEDWTVQHIS